MKKQPRNHSNEDHLAHHRGRHDHQHSQDCGHRRVRHKEHIDYLHDGHLHCLSKEGVVENRIEVSEENPELCTPEHHCEGHLESHHHHPGCGHDAIPHGDHTDYLVEGHLHHIHDGHCDNHGRIELAA